MVCHVMPLLKVSPGRSIGIPQHARIASGFMLAWTEYALNYGVRTMQVPSSILN
jgi:hypothetical protein